MSKDLVMVFLREPLKGKVKTRLAATVGEDDALNIYRRLLYHTIKVVAEANHPRQAWYADRVPDTEPCASLGFDLREQHGTDLGNRMAYAFEYAFREGWDKVIVIGADCPGISGAILDETFARLEDHDSVIGPTRDGGYYLLGIRRMVPELFRNKTWSSDSVAKDTMDDFERMGLSYARLPMLIYVDTEADLADVVLP